MNKKEIISAEILLDRCNRGFIVMNSKKEIMSCNEKAKSFFGLQICHDIVHDKGRVSPGDIVIIATSGFGVNDGKLTTADLRLVNINDSIKRKDVLLAIGEYMTSKSEAEYKFINESGIGSTIKLDVKKKDLHLTALINSEQRLLTILVDDKNFSTKYWASETIMVIIDGITGKIKYYNVANGNLLDGSIRDVLLGKEYLEKPIKDWKSYVIGKSIEEVIDEKNLFEAISMVSDGKIRQINDKFFLLNHKPYLCSIIPIRQEIENDCVVLVFQNVECVEKITEEKKSSLSKSRMKIPLKITRKRNIHKMCSMDLPVKVK